MWGPSWSTPLGFETLRPWGEWCWDGRLTHKVESRAPNADRPLEVSGSQVPKEPETWGV